jgi:hypothetical protein
MLPSTSRGGGIIPRRISHCWSDAIRRCNCFHAFAKGDVGICFLSCPPSAGSLNHLPGKRPAGSAFADQKLGSSGSAGEAGRSGETPSLSSTSISKSDGEPQGLYLRCKEPYEARNRGGSGGAGCRIPPSPPFGTYHVSHYPPISLKLAMTNELIPSDYQAFL